MFHGAGAALALIVVAAFLARLAAARGGIWVDEAWSVLFAIEARDPLGIVFRLNHDNNHHLNTLWLQLVGPAAPTLLMRLPAVLASSAAVAFAALFARHDGRGPMLVTALLVALSPFMLLYGSEARGYALVTCALFALMAVVRDWLEGGPMRRGLAAAITGLGLFSHLVMLPGFVCILGWAWLAKGGQKTPLGAIRAIWPALDLAVITGAATAFIIIGNAMMVGGLGFGSYSPFAPTDVLTGLGDMVELTLGLVPLGWNDAAGVALAVALLALLIALPLRADVVTLVLGSVLLLGMPVAVLLLQPGNTGFGRYYLLGALGLVLLLGNRLGRLLDARGGRALAGALLLAPLLAAMAWQSIVIIERGRGMPQRPVARMAAIAPAGTSVITSMVRASAPLRVAAAQRGYGLRVLEAKCDGAAPFLLVSGPPMPPVGARARLCEAWWRRIDRQTVSDSSTEPWALYAREGLQSGRAIANGPPPAR